MKFVNIVSIFKNNVAIKKVIIYNKVVGEANVKHS